MKQQALLDAVSSRLGIDALNAMQRRVLEARSHKGDIVLYAPTGSGKTLAFALPMLRDVQHRPEVLQAVVVAPSRELALQTHRVIQALATGVKVTCCYGGHSVDDERLSLLVVPAIIVATPGRLLDHIERGNIDVRNTRWLVLDEFDKTLELGFGDTMRSLLRHMPNLSRRLLTSATTLAVVPDYVRLHNALTLDFRQPQAAQACRLTVWSVASEADDKLCALRQLLLALNGGKAIVFVNYRDAVQRVHSFLRQQHIASGMYHGGMEQHEREMALAMFANGSCMVLVTTDLAARGLDIEDVQHIVHYHLPTSAEAYTHRNGRTARVEATGCAYVLLAPAEDCPDYVHIDDALELPVVAERDDIVAPMATLHFKAGRKEKLSRGDVLGFIVNNSSLNAGEVGRIDLHDHYTLAAVPANTASHTLQELQKAPVKRHRVRITLINHD